METDELEIQRAAEVARSPAAPEGTSVADPRATDERAILALQRSAGNRAVGGLLAGPRGGATRPASTPYRRASFPPLVVQRGPGDEIPSEDLPRPIAWPEEVEGERNEPCFDEDSRGAILVGSALANGVAADLGSMPPDLQGGLAGIKSALGSLERASGAQPGQGRLDEATDLVRRAAARLSVYAEPVAAMLEQLSTAAVAASTDALSAAGATTEPPKPAEGEEAEEPRPCFEEEQKAAIAQGAALADAAAAELARRPPDYRKALGMLSRAYTVLDGQGGQEPGQSKLRGALATLDKAINAVDAYLTPVEQVVADVAADLKDAGAVAGEAMEMAKPGPYAAGGAEGSATTPVP